MSQFVDYEKNREVRGDAGTTRAAGVSRAACPTRETGGGDLARRGSGGGRLAGDGAAGAGCRGAGASGQGAAGAPEGGIVTADPVLTLAQAARWLGVGRTTLWRLHAEYGALPAPVRLSPGRVGYRRSTLENYINQLEAV